LTTRQFGDIAPASEKGCLNFLYSQLQTNPQCFPGALSLMEGQIILIPGGLP